MSRVIAVANQKGGVGKTTTAVNLASCLAAAERLCLLVDFDPQSNSTSGVGLAPDPRINSYRVVMGEIGVTQAIANTEINYLKIVPSHRDLVGATVELVSALSRETKLRRALDPVRGEFDFIFIDCPPSLDLLTLNALAAADSVLVPLQCEYYALEGLSSLLGTIEAVRGELNPKLELEGLLLTMYNVNTRLSQQVMQEAQRFFGDKVFKSIIPRNVRLSESPSHGKPIILYDIGSKGAESYLALARELMGRYGEGKAGVAGGEIKC